MSLADPSRVKLINQQNDRIQRFLRKIDSHDISIEMKSVNVCMC